jgi:hypothetical protein
MIMSLSGMWRCIFLLMMFASTAAGSAGPPLPDQHDGAGVLVSLDDAVAAGAYRQTYTCIKDCLTTEVTTGLTTEVTPQGIPNLPTRQVTAAGELALLGLALMALGLHWGRRREHPEPPALPVVRTTSPRRRLGDRRPGELRQADRRLHLRPDY